MGEETTQVEAVLAFVHDTKPWAKMEPTERREYQRRVKYVLSDESNDTFGKWSQTKLAPVLGVPRTTLTERLAWSESVSDRRPDTGTPIEVRRARSDLKKPGVLDALLEDPDVEAALMDGLARKMEQDAERIRDSEPSDQRSPRERKDHTIAALLKFAVNGSLAWEKAASLVRGGSPDELDAEDQSALEDAGSRTITAVAEVTTTVTEGVFV